MVVILSSARDATAVGFIPGQPGTGLEPFSFFNSCGLVVLRNDDFHKKARKASVHGPRLWPWAWCEERQLVRRPWHTFLTETHSGQSLGFHRFSRDSSVLNIIFTF